MPTSPAATRQPSRPTPAPVRGVVSRPPSAAPDTRIALAVQSGETIEVRLVRWPEESEVRAHLGALGGPCLLVVGADAPPPPAWGALEDWVREPVDDAELELRCRTLAHRAAAARATPRVDADGLLRFSGRWTQLTDAQVAWATLLTERFGAVVRVAELDAAAAAVGVSTHGEARKAALRRFRARLAPVGLVVRSVRGSGYALTTAGPAGGIGNRRPAPEP